MAHKIYFNQQNAQHSFFSVKEKPWHEVGQIIDAYPTSKEALTFAGLNYTVEKRNLFLFDNENQQAQFDNESGAPKIEVPDHYATIRTDTQEVLGVVGKDYEVVQNVDAFNFFDAIVEGDGVLYETAGAIGKGERIFVTAKLPDYIRVGKEDLIEKYLFLTTSHDGFGSITAAFTPVRIVCHNTLHAALRNCTNTIKIRHTQNAKDRLEEAHKVMGISNQLAIQLEEVFNHWIKISITDAEVKKLIQQSMAPSKEVLQKLHLGKEDELSTNFKNICDNVFEYGMSNPTQQTETTKGTVFGVYNAVTGYFQNVRSYKDGEAKLKSILYGTGLQRTQQAFILCEDFAKHGKELFRMN